MSRRGPGHGAGLLRLYACACGAHLLASRRTVKSDRVHRLCVPIKLVRRRLK
jgi:hypothetical protein